MLDFKDIKQFTRESAYAVDIGWDYLPSYYAKSVNEDLLNVSPDFQRAYVWTPEQKVRYIEFILQGGATGRNVYCNCPTWNLGGRGDYVLVDGKQRVDAVLGWLNNEFSVFGGHFRRDITGWIRHRASFRWHINDLKSRDEMLQWYIDLNAGGTIHSTEEIDRVRAMKGQGDYVAPSPEEVKSLGNLDREVLQEVMREDAEREKKLEAERAAHDAARAAAPKRRRRA